MRTERSSSSTTWRGRRIVERQSRLDSVDGQTDGQTYSRDRHFVTLLLVLDRFRGRALGLGLGLGLALLGLNKVRIGAAEEKI